MMSLINIITSTLTLIGELHGVSLMVYWMVDSLVDGLVDLFIVGLVKSLVQRLLHGSVGSLVDGFK